MIMQVHIEYLSLHICNYFIFLNSENRILYLSPYKCICSYIVLLKHFCKVLRPFLNFLICLHYSGRFY